MWLLDSADERYDTVRLRGARSLRQVRRAGTGTLATNLEDRLALHSDTGRYSLHAWLKTANAESASADVRFYTARTGSTPIGSAGLGAAVSGTSGWTFYHHEFSPADQTAYIDVRATSTGPQSGSGTAWFDDVGVIQWEGWQPLTAPVPVLQPNEYYWIQARTRSTVSDALLTYQETSLDPPLGTKSPRALVPVCRSFSCAPNPAGKTVSIAFDLTRPARVTLKVFDVTGRKVRTLVDRFEPAGSREVRWDGTDDRGEKLGRGSYFCRLDAGGQTLSTKLVLSR
jgi:hypothetical protein